MWETQKFHKLALANFMLPQNSSLTLPIILVSPQYHLSTLVYKTRENNFFMLLQQCHMFGVDNLERDNRKRQKLPFIISVSSCFDSGQGMLMSRAIL